MNYNETIAYLYEQLPFFQRDGIKALKYDLQNISKLLNRLNHPEKKFKSIHIAGTNGKGSSAHALASILQMAGYKTGLYTSPHLKSFTERIKVNGEEISEDFVIEFTENVKTLILELKPTFFEITVSMAFHYFAQRNIDIAVIETGLGGKLDSTNIITPEVCLITRIAFDHMQILGDTLSKIASSKAGIIKERVPVVVGWNENEALEVLKNTAILKNAPFYYCGSKQNITENNKEEINYIDDNEHWIFKPDLKASYFFKNIPAVIEVVKVLKKQGWNIDNQSITEGINQLVKNTGLKGRFQILQQNPMIVADISHNENGIEVLFEQINKLKYNQLHIIFGCVKDKNVNSILKLLPKNAKYYFSQSQLERALAVEELVNEAKKEHLVGLSFKNVNDAISKAKSVANREDIILITGSTFLVAEIDDL